MYARNALRSWLWIRVAGHVWLVGGVGVGKLNNKRVQIKNYLLATTSASKCGTFCTLRKELEVTLGS